MAASTRPRTLIGSVLLTTLVILAFVFSLILITSKDWAHQSHFSTDLERLSENKAVYVTFRSPFKICDYAADEQIDQDKNPACTAYRPFGAGKTSCESRPEQDDTNAINFGDPRLCQQIHFAGNLAISSAVFLGVALLTTFAMVALTMRSPQSASSEQTNTEAVIEGSKETHPHGHKHTASKHTSSTTAERNRWINVFLLFCLAAGSVQIILSQYYGILAFIQSQPDNGAFSGRTAAPPPGSEQHNPWVQGKALSIFGSIGWLSGVLAMSASLLHWGLPRSN